eukprot:5714564-Prymnesium_polylepis.1
MATQRQWLLFPASCRLTKVVCMCRCTPFGEYEMHGKSYVGTQGTQCRKRRFVLGNAGLGKSRRSRPRGRKRKISTFENTSNRNSSSNPVPLPASHRTQHTSLTTPLTPRSLNCDIRSCNDAQGYVKHCADAEMCSVRSPGR